MLYCPKCQSERIQRSRRRNTVERSLLAMIFVRPFRCLNCDLRFFRWSFTAHPNSPRPAATQW